MQGSYRLSINALAAATLLVASTVRAESTKLWSFKPEKGFVSDAMAFDADESRFAYIHTDSAQFLNIEIISTSDFKKVTTIKIDDPTRVPRRLEFTPDGQKLVYLWMDGYKGTRGAMLFQVSTGKRLKQIGPGTYAELISFKGQQTVTLTTQKPLGDGGNRLAISAHRTADFRRISSGQVLVQADLRIKRPPLRVMYWEPGHASLMGMQKGEYDKKRDIRLPDRAVRYNVLTRKTLWSEEPKDLVIWTRTTTMRPNHPGQLRFLQVSDDLKKLHLVNEVNELAQVTTPVKWSLYEPKSLKQAESWDGETLHFSMTIDPVNPDAVKRQKADKERMDLYRLDPGPKATPLGQVYTGKRRFSWIPGKNHFAYLFKLKGFGRGGRLVVVYRVGS